MTIPTVDYRPWHEIAAAGTAPLQHECHNQEAQADLIRSYSVPIVNGLLQTRAYAEVILRRCIDFTEGTDDLAAAVEARMQRQEALHNGTTRFHLLVDEKALHTRVGDTATYIEQLEHLLQTLELPQITLGIVPIDAEFTYTTNNFAIYDRHTVGVETISADLNITQPPELASYEKAWNALHAQAIYNQAVSDLIANLLSKT